jgi:predicted DCC family thiol-disulfide oxidoreductase YuxK
MVPADPSTDETWTVLYDADCGFCRSALAGLLALDHDKRVRPLALQAPEAATLLADVDPTRRNESWHLISPSGERFSAGAGGAALLRLLRGGRVPATVLAAAPGATEHAYRWVADHRSTLSRLVPSGVKERATERIARHGR